MKELNHTTQQLNISNPPEEASKSVDIIYKVKQLTHRQSKFTKTTLPKPSSSLNPPRLYKYLFQKKSTHKQMNQVQAIQISDDEIKIQEPETNRLNSQIAISIRQIRYYTEIMNNYVCLENNDQSLKTFSKLEQLYEKANQKQSFQFANLLCKVADIHIKLKRYSHAEKILYSVVAIRQKYSSNADEAAKKLKTLQNILNLQKLQLAHKKQVQQGQVKIEAPLIMLDKNQQNIRHIACENFQEQTRYMPRENFLQENNQALNRFKQAIKKGKSRESKKKYVDAIRYYQQAEKLYLAEHFKQDQSYCQLLSSIADCHQQLDHNLFARAVITRKIQFLEERADQDTSRMAEALFQYASNELYLNSLHSALKYFTKALRLTDKVGGPSEQDLSKYAEGILGIACEFRELSRHQKIREMFMASINLFKQLKLEQTEQFSIFNYQIAKAYYHLGQYKQCNQYNFETLRIMESIGKLEHFRSAKTYNNIGANYKVRDIYGEAIKYYQKAIELRKKLLGDQEDCELADYYQNLACAYEDSKNNEKAEMYYAEQWRIRKLNYGKDSQKINLCAYNLLRITYKLKNSALLINRLDQSVQFSNQVKHKYEIKRMIEFVVRKGNLSGQQLQKLKEYVVRMKIRLTPKLAIQ